MEEKKLIQFLKYCVVGASNTLINQGIYIVIIFFRGNYLFASLMGFVISVLNAYYWSNKYVFKEQKDRKKRVWWKVLLKTYMAYAGGFVLNALLLILWIDVIKISRFMSPLAGMLAKWGLSGCNVGFLGETFASVLNLVIIIPLNYVLNKYWAYKQQMLN